MNNFSKILWGIVFIVVGLIIGLNAFDILSVNLFFDGWWTLIIIIPCLIGLFNNEEENKTGNLIRNNNRTITITFNKRNNRL